ncbi:MAG: lysophospholipid acyltransferase family protein [Anaerolineae bacterium]
MSEDRPYPPFRPFWFGIASSVIRLLFALCTRRFTVEGVENVPQEGPLIFVANHVDYLDSPAIAMALPRQMNILAADTYRTHPIFGPIVWTGGAIWVNREGISKEAIKQALAVLKDGGAIGMSVEGTRSRSGTLGEGKLGAAYLANRGQAMIQPEVVWGTELVFPSQKRLSRADFTVRYGEPFALPAGRARTEELAAHTDQIMRALADLLPDAYRGDYVSQP